MAAHSPELKEGYQRVEFQNTLWEVPVRYQDLRAIGIGAFGSVCSALDTELGIRVAIKKLSRPFQSPVHAKRAYREIRLLNHMNHENVIRLLNVFTPTQHFKDFSDVYLVTELMGSDLHKIVRTQSLSDEHVQFFIYQILRGLKYVHSAGVIHRDIKPSNIGVSEDCEIKILDFGLGRQIGEQMTGYVMTRYWRAPEIMLNWMRYGQKADIWSVGCVMAELLTGQILFPGNDYRDHLERILQICGRPEEELLQKIESDSARRYIRELPPYPKKDFDQFFVGANAVAIDLLTQLLQIDPDKRPSAEEALQHQYFAKYHFPKDEPVCDRKYDASFEEMTKEIGEWKELTFKDINTFVCPPVPRPTTHPKLASYDTSQLSQTDSNISTESPAPNPDSLSPMAED